MHTLLRVGLFQQNTTNMLVEVKQMLQLVQLLNESLRTDFDDSNKVQKERMVHKLEDIFGSDARFHYLCLDAKLRSSTPEKSSFVNIMVNDKKHILLITAEYTEIKSLRELAAMVVARCFKDKNDVEKLKDVPKCLFDDIKEFV
eukprot:GFUD01015956.1.p1 GENE.GFUD01015956.1~~GFUD01015956.1.p1  ORF type:complete len:144 (-),score=37.33 GFUD01015956.1:72-503(-)